MNEQQTFPMLPEKSWWILRDKFQSSLPVTLSTTYVKSLLSLGSDASAKSNIIAPMKRIGLIDEESKPTALANEWRIDENYRSVCDTIIKEVYPQELLDLFPDRIVDRSIAKNWFMGRGVGSKTADSMISLFALLKNGEIKGKQNSTSNTAKKPLQSKQTQKTERKSKEEQRRTNPESNLAALETNPHGSMTNRPNLHIDLQIHISPQSTPEQVEAIFASMAKHLYGVDKS